MPQSNDLSRSPAALDQDSTLIAVIEMSQSSWLVAGIVPGIERHPAKKLEPDEAALLRLLHRWRDEAGKAGRTIRLPPTKEIPGNRSGGIPTENRQTKRRLGDEGIAGDRLEWRTGRISLTLVVAGHHPDAI